MQINKEFLKSLNPCANRYEHFLEHYGEFSGSLSDFLGLPDLDYDDKIWVAKKVLTKNQAISWGVLCAESVVHIFEAKRPDDKRLINCINFLKSINDFNSLTIDQALEIKRHESDTDDIIASNSATDAAYYASYAAYAAAYSATFAASVSEDVYAAAYATKHATYAARFAFHAASNSINDDAEQKQKYINLQFLKQVVSL